MTIAFVGDVHIGNHSRFGGQVTAGINERAQLALDCLERALSKATEQGAQILVVLGDLFDSAHPAPQLIAATGRLFRAWLNTGPPRTRIVYLLAGNHDQASELPGDHALGPLGLIDGVQVIDKPTGPMPVGGNVDLLLLPWSRTLPVKLVSGLLQSYPDPQGVPGQRIIHHRTRRVVGMHVGIADERTPSFMRAARDYVYADALLKEMAAAGFHNAICANWHLAGDWQGPVGTPTARIAQVGALCPTGFDNPGDGYGGLVTVEQYAQPTRYEIPGPRFRTHSAPTCPYRRVNDPNISFVEWRVPPGVDLTKAAAQFEATGHRGEVVPDRERAAAGQANAAAAVGAASTVDEAVAGYVASMPLVDGVARSEVLEQVNRFVREGSNG